MASLKDIAKASTSSKTESANKKPIGQILVYLADVVVFSRAIWADSTSESPLLAEINQLALDDEDGLVELLESLFKGNDLVHVEVSMNRPKSDTSLGDILKALKK